MNFSMWVGSVRRELTPWFGGDDRPARTGVYQRNFPAGPYSRWNGVQWLEDAAGVAAAAVQIRPSRYQKASWRGLVEAAEIQAPSASPEGTGSSSANLGADRPS